MIIILNKAPMNNTIILTQESSIAGVIILERCKMDADNEGGNRYGFKLG